MVTSRFIMPDIQSTGSLYDFTYLVSVRDENARLVEQFSSNRPVNLVAGRYTFSAVVPDGEVILGEQTLTTSPESQKLVFNEDVLKLVGDAWASILDRVSGGDDVALTTSIKNKTLSSSTTVDPHIAKHIDQNSWFMKQLTNASQFLDHMLYRGNILTGDVQRIESGIFEASEGGFPIITGTTAIGVYHLVLRLHERVCVTSLPITEVLGCNCVAYVDDAGWPRLSIRFENPLSQSILTLMEEERSSEVATFAQDSIALMRGKRQDAIGATIGAYALLQSNRLTPLLEWSSNLANLNPWLPDARIIFAEALARNGEHSRALELFSTLPRVGLPIFTRGLGIVMNRLESLKQMHKLKNSIFNQGVADLRDDISQLIHTIDPDEMFLTFRFPMQHDIPRQLSPFLQ